MAPDDSKVPFAPIDDVLVEPVSMDIGIRSCHGSLQLSLQCPVRLSKLYSGASWLERLSMTEIP